MSKPKAPFEGHFDLHVPFIDTISLACESWGEGRARTRLPLRREITNSRGEAQGGSIMTALDFAMSAAARSAYADPVGAATIDMNTSFLAPALSDLVIDAACIKAGRALAFCEAEARDAKGHLVARGTATFKMIHRKEP